MALSIAGRLYGPERRRYADPATEFEVIRLTDPVFASGFTAPGLRQFTRRSENLLHWSDRGQGDQPSNARQAFLLNLKDGDFRQLTDAAAIHPETLSLTNDDRSVLYFDGGTLHEAALNSLKTREVHRLRDPAATPRLAVLTDASIVVSESAALTRISGKTSDRTITFDGQISLLLARPKHAQVLVRTGDQFFLADPATGAKKALKLEPGQTGQTAWTPSGKTFTYIHVPEDPKQLITLRENSPDEGTDKLLAKTSQFESASPNADSSVFAGASRSKASPYVLILLRVTRRELTLCEHRASNPAMVQPVFSPDSQSVFFVSDRHGKQAIYRVHVEKFVEETEPV